MGANTPRLGITGLINIFHQFCMKHIKSQVRTRITDVYLENCLRVATSLEINFDALSSAKQSQTSVLLVNIFKLSNKYV